MMGTDVPGGYRGMGTEGCAQMSQMGTDVPDGHKGIGRDIPDGHKGRQGRGYRASGSTSISLPF